VRVFGAGVDQEIEGVGMQFIQNLKQFQPVNVTDLPGKVSIDSFRCFICDSKNFRKIFTKKEKDFLKCQGCNLICVSPLPSPDEIKAYYEKEYELDTGMYRALVQAETLAQATAQSRLRAIRKYISGQRLLDIGCSTGAFLGEAAKAGYECEGIDISTLAIEIARSNNCQAYATIVENFSTEAQYDVVTGFDVLEHVLDPVSFLKSVYNLLKPNRILALTSHDTRSIFCRFMGRHWYFYMPEEHLFNFNRKNLSLLLSRLGFEVLHYSRAHKILHYDYGLIQFQAYNPLVYYILKSFSYILPAALRRYPIKFYIGEMMIVARRK